MTAKLVGTNVRAQCPDCDGSITTFESVSDSKEFGCIGRAGIHECRGVKLTYINYRLMRCASCGRGGLAEIHGSNTPGDRMLDRFYPATPERAKLPGGVPACLVNELREAEDCMGIGAFRAASALFRSVLEKTLKENGYTDEKLRWLPQKIEAAVKDGVMSLARSQDAHENIKVLGDDVVHDEWRAVPYVEAAEAHHYTQRILEDLYGRRETVEKLLVKAGRLKPPDSKPAAAQDTNP